ncbi:MAG: CoB--CoM heterodisulfide reductase iron-sulfur subunit B family protein [Candidatus Edwardsbacteria bacterium]
MKYALFLGCTVPVRGTHYELSARKVANRLGLEFVEIEDFSCCGFPVKATNAEIAFLLAARNLSLAESKDIETICTLCSSCTSTLTEAAKRIKEEYSTKERVNKQLSHLKREVKGKTKIKHFARLIYEEIGLENIRKLIQRPLNSLKVAVHSGCHYLKPSEVFEHFDEPEIPRTLKELVEVTGTFLVEYPEEKNCCGGATMGIDEMTGLRIAKKKLDSVKENKADALIVICPFCDVMYEANQKKIEQTFNENYALPILYYPQLLGLALGIEPKELGFQFNTVKADSVLTKIGL